jgi:hypothetical protein
MHECLASALSVTSLVYHHHTEKILFIFSSNYSYLRKTENHVFTVFNVSHFRGNLLCPCTNLQLNHFLNISIFWNTTPCSQFVVSEEHVARNHQAASYLLHVDFLFSLFFDPEDEDDMFLRNVS